MKLPLRTLIAAVSVVYISVLMAGCQTKEREVEGEKGGLFSERDGLELAMRQEFLMTRDPALNYIPKERLREGRTIMQRLIAARGGSIQDIQWEERGPNNIAGRTRAFFIDSRDATGNTVFSASVSGGIWKATNFKTVPVWTPVAEDMDNLAVCALAQDPSNPSVMYAGTGEGWFNNDAVRGNGIFKSTNGGSTWTKLPSTDSAATSHNFDFIQDIVVNSAGVVFATGRPSVYCNTGGIFRSSNGGSSWSRTIGRIKQGEPCDSAYDYFGGDLEIASNGDVYATTGLGNEGEINSLGRIFRSSAATNGANVGSTGTWIDITPPGTWKRIELAIAPSNPAVVYALLQGNSDGIGAIKKSINSGTSWIDLPLPTWCSQGVNSTDFTNDQAWFDLIVAVDPNDPNTAYIGGIDILKTTNGGTSWTQVTQWASGCQLPTIHPDQHNIQFFPGSSNEMIVSNDGGLYYTNNKGDTWDTYPAPSLFPGYSVSLSNKNKGYNITQLYGCDLHPTQTNYMLAGSQDNGTQRYTNPGMNSTTESSLGGDGGIPHIDQTDGAIQVLSYVYNNFFYSRNNGQTFTSVKFNNNGLFINPSDYDDVKNVMYTANNLNQMGLVTNLSGSGNPIFTAVTINALGSRKISAVKVDPTVAAGGTIWIAGNDSTFEKKPVILKLTNANTTTPTVAINTTLSAVPAGSFISSIDVDPANANHILITLSNYGVNSVFESTNGGTSFTNIEGNLPDMPVRSGMFVPANASVNGTTPGGILIGTELGVWYTPTTNGASTSWVPQGTKLPRIRTDMLKYRASDNLLAAATHGRGLFTSKLTSLATGIPSVDNTKSFIKYTSASQTQLLIKIGNLNLQKVHVEIFDATGRMMYRADVNYADQVVNISGWSAGTYTMRITGKEGERYVQQFVK